ncbi:hypothetical protein SELMODRAFT_112350 [Selaginella moellendorffii]|uniref:Equilibrative nucleoside transporter n=1 Tax=Selaginella moellendorffii TaxID=88036 RepID=D8SAF5_SELML|nr:hypothetical protein SELMODRAFT_112350 [Selaginella moellendorffii]
MEPTTGARATLLGHLTCWILGVGAVLTWNSMLSAMDYYLQVFSDYYPSRVLPLVYQPISMVVVGVLTAFESEIITQYRVVCGFWLFFFVSLFIPVLDLACSGLGSFGTYVGVCIGTALFGTSGGCVEAGVVGVLSYTHTGLLQSFTAGVAASGVATSCMRLITKASFAEDRAGLRKGALAFFFISAIVELVCVVLYIFVFRRFTKRVQNEAIETEPRLSNTKLLKANLDYVFNIFIIHVVTLAIFPGILAKDSQTHQLRSWYVVTLVTVFNVGDMAGRYFICLNSLKLKNRTMLFWLVLVRFALVPAFYFGSQYEGWTIVLCFFLGTSNGHFSVCVFVNAPKGYKVSEQSALGNILVLALLSGVFVGEVASWMWLI